MASYHTGQAHLYTIYKYHMYGNYLSLSVQRATSGERRNGYECSSRDRRKGSIRSCVDVFIRHLKMRHLVTLVFVKSPGSTYTHHGTVLVVVLSVVDTCKVGGMVCLLGVGCRHCIDVFDGRVSLLCVIF